MLPNICREPVLAGFKQIILCQHCLEMRKGRAFTGHGAPKIALTPSFRAYARRISSAGLRGVGYLFTAGLRGGMLAPRP